MDLALSGVSGNVFRATDCLVGPDSCGKIKSDLIRGKTLSRNRKSRGGSKTDGFH